MRFGAHNAPAAEEAHNLFLAWEQIAPLLRYVEKDPTWVVFVGLRKLLVLTPSGSATAFVS